MYLADFSTEWRLISCSFSFNSMDREVEEIVREKITGKSWAKIPLHLKGILYSTLVLIPTMWCRLVWRWTLQVRKWQWQFFPSLDSNSNPKYRSCEKTCCSLWILDYRIWKQSRCFRKCFSSPSWCLLHCQTQPSSNSGTRRKQCIQHLVLPPHKPMEITGSWAEIFF